MTPPEEQAPAAGGDDLAARLSGLSPFDALDPDDRAQLVAAGRVERHPAGTVLLDAFVAPAEDVLVVLAGRVELWEEPGSGPAGAVLGPGGLFGFSALLTGRAIGPRAVAMRDVTVARLPRSAVEPVFATGRGARFLADELTRAVRRPGGTPSYSVVDDLVTHSPLVVDPDLAAAEVARLMTEHGTSYAAVPLEDGTGLLSDAVLRRRLVAEGLPSSTPARELADTSAPHAELGDSTSEALLRMLEVGADLMVVTDRAGRLQGVLSPRDFVVSPSLAGVSLHEQLRRSTTVAELTGRARRVPDMLQDLVTRGLSSDRVIAVHASVLDTICRRAIALVFAGHPDLDLDAFTWLSLGSTARREAVLGSDVDSAVAFVDGTPAAELTAYRTAFAEVGSVLAAAGLAADEHGASADQPLFSRTNDAWRRAARDWMAGPEQDKGAVMAALLVDARPIHGDPGLPAATRVVGELRTHPGTMRLLLQEALAARARVGHRRGLVGRKPDTFEVKTGALQPIVRIARWAALTAGSPALSTVERLHAAAGTAMLPTEQAETLVEVFEVLQRLRLRHQLHQHREGEAPTDTLELEHVSAIDRAVISQAVREVVHVQRRMATVSSYTETSEWTASP